MKHSKKQLLLLDEIHPDEILLEDFMKPLRITTRQLAADKDAVARESRDRIAPRIRVYQAVPATLLGSFERGLL